MKKILALLLPGLLYFGGNGVVAQDAPAYLDPSRALNERVDDLVERMTLEEKVSQMTYNSPAIPRLEIPEYNWWNESLHGVGRSGVATVFPQAIGLGATFDERLIHEIATAVSDEARAMYNVSIEKGYRQQYGGLTFWTPNINIFRDPRWGRGQETYGEDPFLTSQMGVSVVKGLQGPEDSKYKKLLACAKHYAVHSGPEWSRHELNLNNVAPRDMWETYLPAFKSLVQEADVRQVMCAYQRLHDEPCCSNTRLLQKILREDWGYQHLVVADCGAISDFYTSHNVSSDATHAAARGVLAGTDLECQWDNHNYKLLPEAVQKGLITEEEIDVRLMRVLKGRFDLGEMDDDAIVPWAQIPISVVNNEEHRKLALDMALQSMTLLQNKNNIKSRLKN